MQRVVRVALMSIVLVLTVFVAPVSATPRLTVGFFDDPSFRWAAKPDANFKLAQSAHASVVHVLADWSQIAADKPQVAARRRRSRVPALPTSTRSSARRPATTSRSSITISGTPKWANGGKTPNVPPTNLSNLTQFAQMLSARYNGLHPGFGSVSRWTVWNEPNLEQFLKPQFDGNKIVSPAAYAKLYMAAYKGIKAGNPLADVAVGSTSNRGRNKPTDQSGSVAPATFARLLAQANPNLPFAAWATHPYPTSSNLGPGARAAYPAVTMTRLDQFGKDLEKWFHRRVPIWVTEYAEQTRPEYPLGVSYAQQAADAKIALDMAAASPYVEMFVWFIIKDSTDKTWNSGLVSEERRQEAVVRHVREDREGHRRPGAADRRRASRRRSGSTSRSSPTATRWAPGSASPTSSSTARSRSPSGSRSGGSHPTRPSPSSRGSSRARARRTSSTRP